MTFQQLQYVIALDETGSFTAAAQACAVTQPTLSAQVRKLEQEWGTPLFDRSRQPVRPTVLGQRVVTEARAALDRLRALAEGVRLERTDLGGTLDVAVLPTLAPYLLPRVLPGVRERLPRVTLRVTEAQTAEIADQVARGRWDVGLVSTPTGREGFDERPLFRERFTAYLGPDSPHLAAGAVTVGDLKEAGLLVLREGHCFRDQVLSFCGGTNPGPVRFEGGSLDTLMRLVDAGFGATLLPEGLVLDLDEVRAAQVRPLEGADPHRIVGLLTALDTPKAALVAAFEQAVRESLPSRWRQLS